MRKTLSTVLVLLKVIILLLLHAKVDICSIFFISENNVCADKYDPSDKLNTLFQESQILKP